MTVKLSFIDIMNWLLEYSVLLKRRGLLAPKKDEKQGSSWIEGKVPHYG